MASQALLTPAPPLELQRDAQRKLRRCLLRLQQYEILLKALVAHGFAHNTLTSIPSATAAAVGGK